VIVLRRNLRSDPTVGNSTGTRDVDPGDQPVKSSPTELPNSLGNSGPKDGEELCKTVQQF